MTNAMDVKMLMVTLLVVDGKTLAPKAKLIPPSTIIETHKLISGDKMSLECPGLKKIDSKKAKIVTEGPVWRRDQRVLDSKAIKRNTHGRVFIREGGRLLLFSPIASSDSGVYECFYQVVLFARFTLFVEDVKSWTDLRHPVNCMVWTSVACIIIFAVINIVQLTLKKKRLF
jgi:hypothetical protein